MAAFFISLCVLWNPTIKLYGFLQGLPVSSASSSVSHNQTYSILVQQEAGTLLEKLKVPLHRIWGQKISSYNNKRTCSTSSTSVVSLWDGVINDGNFLPEKKLIEDTRHSTANFYICTATLSCNKLLKLVCDSRKSSSHVSTYLSVSSLSQCQITLIISSSHIKNK